MRRTVTRIGRTIAITLALALSGMGATVVMAQGGAPAALQQILEALAQLQTSIAGVQQSVDALGAGDNVVVTSPVIVETGIIDCTHINVSAVDKHVLTQMINASTGEVSNESSGANPTPPGRFRGIGAFAPGGFSGTGYCKFTVLDGTKADIRGTLTLTPNIAGNETTTVEVSAH